MLKEGSPELRIRLEIIHTTGDKILDSPLNMIGDKGCSPGNWRMLSMMRIDIGRAFAERHPVAAPRWTDDRCDPEAT